MEYADVSKNVVLINAKKFEIANVSLCDYTKNTSCSLKDAISLIFNISLDNNLTFLVYSDASQEDPHALQMTIIYILILMTGLVGNISTCIVISRNKYMHSATNYYLFSLAVSDTLFLLFGLPQDLHHLWLVSPYMFGEVFCTARAWVSETATNASILTITAFSVERYLAICHPIRARIMSSLSRAVKFIVGIWIFAALSAIPMAYQIGIVYEIDEFKNEKMNTAMCHIKRHVNYSFECSTFVFFIFPGLLMLTIYPLMSFKLMRSKDIEVRSREISHAVDVENSSYQEKELNEHGRVVLQKFTKHSRKDDIKMLGEYINIFLNKKI